MGLDLSISALTSCKPLVPIVSFPSPSSSALSSRWYMPFNSDQTSYEVSSGSRPAHCNRTILLGFGVEQSHHSEMMAMGEITCWLSNAMGGREIGSVATMNGWWNGLRIEEWKTGWIREVLTHWQVPQFVRSKYSEVRVSNPQGLCLYLDWCKTNLQAIDKEFKIKDEEI